MRQECIDSVVTFRILPQRSPKICEDGIGCDRSMRDSFFGPIRASLRPCQRRSIFDYLLVQCAVTQALPRKTWHVVRPARCVSDIYAGAHLRCGPVVHLLAIEN